MAVAALTLRKARETDCIDPRPMDITSQFELLLRSAAAQPEPQRLLFVFAQAGLPDDATPAQHAHFTAGGGGTLTPVMYVDKGLEELAGYPAFVAESHEAGPAWHVVFAAGLSGRDGRAPSADQVEHALQTMLERVRGGMIEGLLALAPSGEALHFH